MLRLCLILPLLLSFCAKDETVSGLTTPDAVWQLSAIGGSPVAPRITIRFPEEGKIAGEAPCNSYTAAQAAPVPWIDIGPIAATRRACPGLALETRYLALLEKMEFVEILGDTMLMTAEDGTELEFRRTGS
jgi:heat shock protein HslJ